MQTGPTGPTGLFVAAEGLEDPTQGVVVDLSGETPVVTDGPPSTESARRAVEAVWRIEPARIVGALARDTGNFELAEDVAREAVAEALVAWSRDGAPANPVGWLLATARRRAIDSFRRRSALDERYAMLAGQLALRPDLAYEAIRLVRMLAALLRGELLLRLGRTAEARAELELAARWCGNVHERLVLLRKAAATTRP